MNKITVEKLNLHLDIPVDGIIDWGDCSYLCVRKKHEYVTVNTIEILGEIIMAKTTDIHHDVVITI
jgi:hypothetical protein